MLHHRRRRLGVGMALAAVVAAAGGLVASGARADGTEGATHLSSPTTVPMGAAVDAAGIALTPADGWAVRRAGVGTYELTFAADVHLDVRSWEVPADVTLRPVGEGRWTVGFAVDGAPVDTAFSFEAAPIDP
jgi:hypothetical protein